MSALRKNTALCCLPLMFAAPLFAAEAAVRPESPVSAGRYVGYTGQTWKDDYGIRTGRCDRAAIGAVLDPPVRRTPSTRHADVGDRSTAILIGSSIGAVIGAKTGRDLDQYDRACIGHALELADNGRPVIWLAQGVTYTVIAGKAKGNACRSYTLRGEGQASGDSTKAAACRRQDGAWVPRG